jgi:hypothetical protein
MKPLKDEWAIVERLLPRGWQAAAREFGAFRRARYIKDPSTLLRVLLFHAVAGSALRQTAALLRAAGVAELSQVALLKRLRNSGDWLAWLAAELCQGLRERACLPEALRVRVVDGTTVQGPGSRSTEWRLHYALDLTSLQCDWQELTDAHGGESLTRVPVRRGDVMLGDRAFFTQRGMAHLAQAGAYAVTRMRWRHARLLDPQGQRRRALDFARTLEAGQVGDWPVSLPLPGGRSLAGRVIAIGLPLPLVERAQRRARRAASKKQHRLHPDTLTAARYVILFTSLPKELLNAQAVLELYRYRWQVELAFKRLKQLLKIGRLPHKDPEAARGWIQAKLVVALLLETLVRNSRTFSPWGFPFSAGGTA